MTPKEFKDLSPVMQKAMSDVTGIINSINGSSVYRIVRNARITMIIEYLLDNIEEKAEDDEDQGREIKLIKKPID